MRPLRSSVRTYSMKRILLQIFIVVCIGLAARAEDAAKASSSTKLDEYMAAGMEVSGIRVPYYDEKGDLQAQLYGGLVKVVERGVAEITKLRIDVYDDGNVIMTIFAPRCFATMGDGHGVESLVVHSDGDVLIEMEQMTIAGTGFKFSGRDYKFEILNNSRVLIKEAARNMTTGVRL